MGGKNKIISHKSKKFQDAFRRNLEEESQSEAEIRAAGEEAGLEWKERVGKPKGGESIPEMIESGPKKESGLNKTRNRTRSKYDTFYHS